MKLPVVGPTYQLATSFDNQRCVNMFPIFSETGTSKEPTALVPTPGLKLFAAAGSGPIRNMLTTSRGRTFAVSGNALYEVYGKNNAANLGTLLTQSGFVGMAENGTELLIVDGPYGYILTLKDDNFQRITAVGFIGGETATFQDGYFIVSRPGTAQFAISGINDGLSWEPLDFTVVESSPDNLNAVVSEGGYLWCFGDQSVEIYQNTGDVSFPFQRISGARLDIGCAAGRTAKPFDGGMMWVATDDDGMRSIVYGTNSSTPRRVSTEAIERKLLESDDLSGSEAYVYDQGGHEFYCVNLQGLNTTICYDAKTQQFHERAGVNSLGDEVRHPVSSHAVFGNKNLVGDRASGNIYEYDVNTYDDNGSTVPRIRVFPHIHNEMNYIRHAELHVDFEPGVGLTTGQGKDPQAMLRYSDDGGFTYSNERWVSIGKKGKYKNRARWKRLGIARSRVYELRITDPVFCQINGAYLRAEGAAT